MSEPIVIGIDLGTTFSAAAYVDEAGNLKVIQNAEGKTTTPSVVLIENGRIVVGDVAVNQWITNEEHVVRWIKRSMGDADYRFQGMSPIEISAEILKALKKDGEESLGQPVTEAVITCPAYFASVEVENTKKAGELAGLTVKEIVKEPTAAAVFYGVENMRDGQTVLVCDLGGGTFDATVLRYANGRFTPLSSMGSRALGGHDWTMKLVDLVAARFMDKHGENPCDDLVAGQLLYEACEQAKRSFARLDQATVTVQRQGKSEPIALKRADFEAATESLILEMVSWCDQALDKANPKLAWQDIDTVLLVGGSSRLRRVKEALTERAGKEPVLARDPDLAVAYGAAILAKGKVRPRKGGLTEAHSGGLIEVLADRRLVRNLGTRVLKRGRIVSACIIPVGSDLPTSAAKDDFEISVDRQTSFDLPVIEFEDAEAETESFELVGSYVVRCLPNCKRGDKVRVKFNYDVSGIAQVEAYDVKTGTKLQNDRSQTYKDPTPVATPQFKPRWVVFVVDVSYSMEGDKIQKAKAAVAENARQLLGGSGGSVKVGVITFGSDATVVCQPTSDLAAVERAAGAIAIYGSTAMNLGIQAAADMVCKAPEGTDRVVVLLTDGCPDDKVSTSSAAAEAKRRGVSLRTLGVGKLDVDEDYLKSLTPLAMVVDSSADIGAGFSTVLSWPV